MLDAILWQQIKTMTMMIMVDDFRIDLDKKVIDWTLEVPNIIINSQYKIDGRILILPVTGNGNCYIEMSTMIFHIIRFSNITIRYYNMIADGLYDRRETQVK